MARQTRSGALAAGVILILLGVIFLAENWYGPLTVWRLAARYWPVVLILIGLRKLYGYFTWEEAASVTAPPPPPIPPGPGRE